MEPVLSQCSVAQLLSKETRRQGNAYCYPVACVGGSERTNEPVAHMEGGDNEKRRHLDDRRAEGSIFTLSLNRAIVRNRPEDDGPRHEMTLPQHHLSKLKMKSIASKHHVGCFIII